MHGIDAVEEMLTAGGDNGEEPEVELVNEVALHKRAVKFAGTELQDVLAGLLLQLDYLIGDVPLDECCVPLGFLQGGRGYVLGKAVDSVGVIITSHGWPSLREPFVGLAPQQEGIRGPEQVVGVLVMFVIPIGRPPLLW